MTRATRGFARILTHGAASGVTMLLLATAAVAHAQDSQQQIAHLGRCVLESGQVVEDCRVGYRTFGKLNASHTNAVLMPTWLYGKSSDQVGLFSDTSKPSRLVDTSRFFGVSLDALGNGVSSSPSNSAKQHGAAFPQFTTRDMVEVQYRVATEVLHIQHAHAIVGLSMGGEQTFMWATLHPDFFDLAVPIVSTPKLTTYDLQSKQIMLEAIASDPDYHDGNYTKQPALKLANLYNVQAVTTPEWRNRETPTATFKQFTEKSEAPVDMDANDRVWQLRAIMSHDILRGKTISEAAKQTRAHWLIIVSEQDHMVVPTPALEWAAVVHAGTYISKRPCAHLIMNCDANAVSDRVVRFLQDDVAR